jgi:hypothetical protein
MTFEEILDQAIAMLQRRGRLTYGALKRQFQLDDAYLEDLKAELIEGQRVAVDEDGRVLVLHLHPWVIGQPFRIGFLDDALGHMMHHQGVWAASGTQIVEWYQQH